MRQVKEARYLREYMLEVLFDNGQRRVVDLGPHLSGELFEPLKDKERFRNVSVNEDIDTIVWENGADMSPDFLYKIGQQV